MTFFQKRYLFVVVLATLLSCESNTNLNIELPTDENSRILLDGTWELKRAKEVKELGTLLSDTSFKPDNWTAVKIPNTIMAALVEAGIYHDPYSKNNMEKINADSILQAWWLTKEFTLPAGIKQKNISLNFDGINYKANVYLNGHLIADSTTILGAFNTFDFDVTPYLNEGLNKIAILLTPPGIGAYTIGFVDWAPTPPDKNMGIWRSVFLKVANEIAVKNTFVYTAVLDTTNFTEAELILSTELVNKSKASQVVTLNGKIDTAKFSYEVEIAAGETKKLNLSSKEIPALHLNNPKAWWPVGYGAPNLCTYEIQANVNGQISAKESGNFGVRIIEDYKNANGHRGYKINGKKILIKGAGWVDQLFLENSPEYDEKQVKYVLDMNMNCIRFEGFWGKNHHVYDLCDQYGLLAMMGFSCQWEWHDYIGTPCNESEYGCADEKTEIELVNQYWNSQIKWMRNHPSVFTWVAGSDFLPHPDLEKKLTESLKEIDPSRPYLGAAKWHTSKVTGNTGVKMEGPYDYVPPIYWYTDTMRGGAFGFNTETGPGPQPPVLSSLKRMLGDSIKFPIDSTWNYHNGRHAFGTMDKYLNAFNTRYGASPNLEDFALMSQIASYEAIRPMFEAFRVNQPNTTGVIQWMLNSAWPETFWQQYDFYLQPTGAYYGTKVANEPVQVIYNYGTNDLVLVNDQLKGEDQLQLKAKLYDFNSNVIFEIDTIVNVAAQSRIVIKKLPVLKFATSLLFTSVKNANVDTHNNYWLSSKKDVMDPNYENSSWIYTPTIALGDFTALRKLKTASVGVKTVQTEAGMSVTITNSSDKIAFGIETSLWQNDEAVAPVFWSDNYILLQPKEERVLHVKFEKEAGKEYKIKVQGVNIALAQ